ncbi:glycine zipper 2TM protein [Pseudomonas duriflava]|uniref:Glycine zipper 2TM protein n=1 Tax=Pseudomonas duriflava TaxID=459528 RepID=A0A562QIX7_9PSED|nr:SH3 domain-containing protein [Pseudomonas duriflava]TWI56633.1 glycine zipper 2TM protein [Pseudomonas duriflava]
MKPLKKFAVLGLVCTTGMGAGCTAMSQNEWLNQENVGTIIGAAAGVLVGSQIGGGNGRTAAMIAGALAGGMLGKTIGSKLDQRDRDALAAQTQSVLDTAQDGQVTTWTSTHSDAQARIVPVSTEKQERQVSIKRLPTIQAVPSMALLNKPYQAVKSANIRNAPDQSADKVGGLAVGTRFTAIGRTDNNWIMVGRKGVSVGYVYAPLVEPFKAPIAQAKPAQAPASDLDTLDVASAKQKGIDLDAIDLDATPVEEMLTAQTTCRTVNYSISSKSGNDQQSVKACQAADGAWELI